MLHIAQQRKLTRVEDDEFNQAYNQITSIILGTEKKINTQQISPWSPELHIAI